MSTAAEIESLNFQLTNLESSLQPQQPSSSLEDYTVTTTTNHWKKVFGQYLVYPLLFLYFYLVILILRPSHCYVEEKNDDTSSTRKFSPTRAFLIALVLFLLCVGLLTGYRYYFFRQILLF